MINVRWKQKSICHQPYTERGRIKGARKYHVKHKTPFGVLLENLHPGNRKYLINKPNR
jgi:hypothetical protein